MSWNDVVLHHGPQAYRAAWRILGHAHDTEDVVQDVLIEAYRRFQAGDVRNWPAFIRRLAISRALDRIRRRKTTTSADVHPVCDHRAGPQQEAVARETQQRIGELIARLPQRQAAVFCLSTFESLSHSQIAETLNISINAVTVALYKSRTALRLAMSETHQEQDR